jgi:hypothetical protein
VVDAVYEGTVGRVGQLHRSTQLQIDDALSTFRSLVEKAVVYELDLTEDCYTRFGVENEIWDGLNSYTNN